MICEYYDSNIEYVKNVIENYLISFEAEEISVIEGSKQPLILEEKKHTPLKTLYRIPDFSSYYNFKSRDFIPKQDNLHRKDIFRSLDLYADLRNKSFRFLFQRYINNLIPTINYRVTVRLIQANNPGVTPEFVITCAHKMGFTATNVNGNIVVEVKRPMYDKK